MSRNEETGRPGAVVPATQAGSRTIALDIVTLADLQRTDETGWRVAAEVAVQADAGWRCGLVHLAGDAAARLQAIHPDVQACVAAGLAQAIDPGRSLVEAKLAIVHDPAGLMARIAAGRTVLPRILADGALLVVNEDSWPLPPGRWPPWRLDCFRLRCNGR